MNYFIITIIVLLFISYNIKRYKCKKYKKEYISLSTKIYSFLLYGNNLNIFNSEATEYMKIISESSPMINKAVLHLCGLDIYYLKIIYNVYVLEGEVKFCKNSIADILYKIFFTKEKIKNYISKIKDLENTFKSILPDLIQKERDEKLKKILYEISN